MNVKPGNITKCKGKYKLSDPVVDQVYLEEALVGSMMSRRESFYMAPEIVQFQSYLKGIDFARCEVYSLAMCIL